MLTFWFVTNVHVCAYMCARVCTYVCVRACVWEGMVCAHTGMHVCVHAPNVEARRSMGWRNHILAQLVLIFFPYSS